ncbi:MAG: hypothetical protein O3B01_10285 [Planctomycetota bacterium]|nr:hypothetical protein [Planctomycetota bacterium]MDA1138959.1 hypothetical protein [Planctomycetota bacterium]
MQEQTPKFEQRIQQFSTARRGVVNTTLLLRLGSLGLACGALSLVLLCGWLPNAFVNMTLFIAAAVFLLSLLILLLARWERFRSFLAEAIEMERLAGGLNSRIISALDFLHSNWQTTLTEAVVERAGSDLQQRFEDNIDLTERNQRRKHFASWLVVFIAIGCTPWFGFGRLAANFSNSWNAVYEFMFPVEYEVMPGYGRHVRLLGKEFKVGLQFKRRGFAQVSLVMTHAEGEERIVIVVKDGLAAHTLTSDVEKEYKLHFEFGERKTDGLDLIFTTRPSLVNMQTELIYPAYTRMLPRTLEGIQQRLLALTGTRITLGFTLSKDLESAVITWEDGEELPLEVLGRFATVSLMHSRARRASFQVKDIHGFELEYPLLIDFEIQRDEKPRLYLPKHVQEEMAFLGEGAGMFGFGVRLQDDYGVTRSILTWQKSTVDNPTSIVDRGEIERLISPPLRKAVVSYEKIFASLNLKPGDRISFQVEAHDNRAPDRQITKSRRSAFFIYQEDLGGLSIAELGFGSGAQLAKGRIAKSRKGTLVREPAGLRNKEKYQNEFEVTVTTSTRAPSVRGEHSQATKDYFRLLSNLSYESEKKDGRKDPAPTPPPQ